MDNDFKSLTPPEKLERKVLEAIPFLYIIVKQHLSHKAKEKWPDWCYFPMAETASIIDRHSRVPLDSIEGMKLLMAASAIIPWRLHKAIYRPNKFQLEFLKQTSPDPRSVPIQFLLHQMPVPCIYITDLPGLEDKFDGVFCFLENDYRHPDTTELRMHYLTKDGKIVSQFHKWTDNPDLLYEKMYVNNMETLEQFPNIVSDTGLLKEFNLCMKHSKDHIQLVTNFCVEPYVRPMAASAIIPWRLHKAIYRPNKFQLEFLKESSPDPRSVPIQFLLHQMPVPCIYIADPPGLEDKFDGVFCFLENDYRYPDTTELRMHYLMKNGKTVSLFHQWTFNPDLLHEKMYADNLETLEQHPEILSYNDLTEEFNLCMKHSKDHIQLVTNFCIESSVRPIHNNPRIEFLK